MKTKTMPAQVAPDPDEGTFEAFVSVFGNKDFVGDIVMPGAFQKSLEAWGSAGDPIPIYWSHRLDDPTYNIGEVDVAREVLPGDAGMPGWVNEHVKAHGGLYVKGRLDDFGMGKQVAYLLKTRRVKQFSFSYDVLRERKSKDNTANELHELLLHEVGPTPMGCNPMTELISAKNQPDPPPGEPEPTKTSPATAGLFRARIDIDCWLATYGN
jgi:HK97 family phage prohead protease